MRTEYLTAAALLVVAGAAGCSPGPETGDRQAGRMSPGMAQLTIDGADAGRIEAVECTQSKHTTAITIGDRDPVAAATISNLDDLTVDWVRFRDANGFTGSYNVGLGGQAQVVLTGSAYQISGVARGFNADKPSQPTNAEFAIEVSC
ncbi:MULTISPECIES: lipoprotein LpqH [Mycolicibacterium]|uniref:lipoprotein LpqH n=1 Tax=Mycolicibacterium TaxID=1866885 RepID=UPI0007EC48D9|nr:lipoprotein LpqH [Mycolicibacterium fortuitum]NOP99426.1 lipoprotein LpqH [Mycolicibacterium fortuitum]OBJ94643.1 hypothetical protein A5638_24535 [Mycolicibacterium fortuitum]